MMTNIDTGGILFLLFSYGINILPILLFIILFIYIIRFIRRTERRAEARLKLDTENIAFQQQQIKSIQELNKRLTTIENILKEVD